MIEGMILSLLKEKERTYYELKRELGVDYGRLDYYLLKLRKTHNLRAVKKGEEIYYTLR